MYLGKSKKIKTQYPVNSEGVNSEGVNSTKRFNVTKKAWQRKESIINGLQEQVIAFGDKIEEICIKANLSLEESGLTEDQKPEMLFRTQISNRLAEFVGLFMKL